MLSTRRPEWLLLKGIGLGLPVLVLAACAMTQPSANDARNVLRQRLDDGNEVRLRLESFEKTDGRSGELMGVKLYELMFTATVEVTRDALYAVGGSLGRQALYGEGENITTTEYQERTGNFMRDFALDINKLKPIRAGDRLLLRGQVAFERRESGWVATGTNFTITHQKGIAGQWGGGRFCAEVSNPNLSDEILLKTWYCEVGIEHAAEVFLKKTNDGYVDQADNLLVRLQANDTLTIDSKQVPKDKIGNIALEEGRTEFRRY